jgi:hypothetical protein
MVISSELARSKQVVGASALVMFLGLYMQKRGCMITRDDEHGHVLLAELEETFGSGYGNSIEKRLPRIEQNLNPIFRALSKNDFGRVGGSEAVGYMLHRVFVQQHGWFVKGLQPDTGFIPSWDTSSPTSLLEGWLPEHISALLQARLEQHGLSFKYVAIMAAMVEEMARDEALKRLAVSYKADGLSQSDLLLPDEVGQVLDMYMSIYMLGYAHGNVTTMTASAARSLHAQVHEVYPTWPQTQEFLREAFTSVAPRRNFIHFNEVSAVIEEIGERYARFQDIECREMKAWLVAAEDSSVGGAGRVRLADFYSMALHDGKWQFSESAQYLRQLGALDESVASNPRVIIPNYISSPSNCIASSAYYSVCCLDECLSIVGQLEDIIKGPEALPSVVASIIVTIPSSTVPGNRTLLRWWRHRLDEIAVHHGGRVPIHGRLFAQWLHYVYPHECQFPHASGSINRQRPEDVEGEKITEISKDEMQSVVSAAPPRTNASSDIEDHRGLEEVAREQSPMWSMSEEIVSLRSSSWRSNLAWLREALLGGALLSFVVVLAKLTLPVTACINPGLSNKHFV